jgi:hypothetical protein
MSVLSTLSIDAIRRAIHDLVAVPNFYAGIAAGCEESVRTRLRLSVGVAIDHVG